MEHWKAALSGAIAGLAIVCVAVPFGIGLAVLIPKLFALAGYAMGCTN